LGVVFGALMHFLIQYFASWGCGFRPRLILNNLNLKEIKETVCISLPRTLGLSLNNIALIVIVALASFLKTGSISVFNFSLNLQNVPLGIVGISYSVAVFPVLAKSFSENNLDNFKNHLKSASRQIIFWSLPISFLFIVLRAQIVRVILGTGSFSWDNTRLVAASLAMFALSMVAQGLIALFARAYYAAGNTKKPLFINLISSISIVIFSFVLLYVFEKYEMFRFFIESLFRVSDIAGTEILMLPLAYSLGTILNFTLLWFHIKKDFMQKEKFFSNTFFQSLGASFFLGVVSYLGLNILSPIFGVQTFWGIFLQGFLSGIFGILGSVLILYLLKNEELRALFVALKTKFEGSKIIKNTEEVV
jgi:putative peptidoglycan lipid II flippase